MVACRLIMFLSFLVNRLLLYDDDDDMMTQDEYIIRHLDSKLYTESGCFDVKGTFYTPRSLLVNCLSCSTVNLIILFIARNETLSSTFNSKTLTLLEALALSLSFSCGGAAV